MATIKELKVWISQDLGMRSLASKKVCDVTSEHDLVQNQYKINIYTFTNCYTIFAKDDDNGGYLGCGVTARKSRPGETWLRGNDLPDGKLNRSTWNRIIKGIVCYELEDISKHANRNNSIADSD